MRRGRESHAVHLATWDSRFARINGYTRALLISLGLADVSYGKWFRWCWKFQLANLILTSGILLFGLAVGY